MKVLLKLVVAHFKQFTREKAALFWTFAYLALYSVEGMILPSP